MDAVDSRRFVDESNEAITVSLRLISYTRNVAVFVNDAGRIPKELYSIINGKEPLVPAAIPTDGFISAGQVPVFPLNNLSFRLANIFTELRQKGINLSPGFAAHERWIENEMSILRRFNKPPPQTRDTHYI